MMAIFTNQATLSYRNGVVSSNVVRGEIVEVLSASKHVLTEEYSAGDTLTYVISILNSGSTTSNGISVTDDLGAYTFGMYTLVPLSYVDGSVAYYVDGVLMPQPTVTVGPGLTVSGLTVPAGGNAIIVYQAKANQYAPVSVDGEITNIASITGEGVCNELLATETVSIANEPILGITKSISPAIVTENGQLTYTFTIQNFGNTAAVATDDLTVSDVFDPILSPITVSYNGTTWTEGVEYTYDPNTGAFATVSSNITVPAADIVQDPETGEWNVTPGVSVITVAGTVRCDSTP